MNDHFQSDAIRWQGRVLLALAGGVGVALLLTAGMLTPDQRGFGTHHALGLPPCSVRQIFQMRCPSCGMTTAWAHLMRGELLASARANAGGMLLGLVTLVAGPWALWLAARGRWTRVAPGQRTAVVVGLLVLATTVVDWCLRIWLGV